MKILQYGIVLLCMVTLWGCGKGNPNAPVTIDPVTGKHPAGWAVNGTGGAHPDVYFASPGSCEECHGNPTDPAGGISKVSCSNPGRSGVACHTSFPHVAGFAAFAIHGSVAKDVASGITGMAHCQKCHGGSYTGGGQAPSCIGCHQGTNPSSNAPHAANWVSGNANGLKHSLTDHSNAPACAQCHLGGTFSHPAPNPAPAGTAPGCFNGTLCHNEAVHALPYVAGHQAAAKASIASCLPCHATPASGSNPRFNLLKGSGVLNPNGCEDCHNRPGIAHPFMWLPGRGTTNGAPTTTSHTSAGTINGSCGLCHGGTALTGGSVAYPGGIAPPSCFSNPPSSINGTSCHFTKPVDTQGADIGCASCHGAPPNSVVATAAPNRAYRHTAHFANITGITCDACHAGFGSPKTSHATKRVFAAVTAPVAINSIFFENNSTATYNTATGQCSNVSCHGGKPKFASGPSAWPAWKSGTAFTLTNCYNCHLQRIGTSAGLTEADYRIAVAAGLKPYIGPFSGNVSPAGSSNNLHFGHAFLIGGLPPALCLNCHPAPGTGHFAQVMFGHRVLPRGFAAVGGTGTRIGTYNATTGSCLTAGAGACHDSGARIWH